ncbi:MAG: hypothetical protein V4590_01305 [Bacteroidota bacterium]
MNKLIHPNYKKASNVIFLTIILSLIKFFLLDDILHKGTFIGILLAILLFFVGVAYLVRIGKNWVKYFLLFLALSSLLDIPDTVELCKQNILSGLAEITISLLDILAIILLFRIPKKST